MPFTVTHSPVVLVQKRRFVGDEVNIATRWAPDPVINSMYKGYNASYPFRFRFHRQKKQETSKKRFELEHFHRVELPEIAGVFLAEGNQLLYMWVTSNMTFTQNTYPIKIMVGYEWSSIMAYFFCL